MKILALNFGQANATYRTHIIVRFQSNYFTTFQSKLYCKENAIVISMSGIRRKKKVPQTYKGTELSNHYYMYCHYVIISSNHERKATFRTLFGILVTADHHHW